MYKITIALNWLIVFVLFIMHTTQPVVAQLSSLCCCIFCRVCFAIRQSLNYYQSHTSILQIMHNSQCPPCFIILSLVNLGKLVASALNLIIVHTLNLRDERLSSGYEFPYNFSSFFLHKSSCGCLVVWTPSLSNGWGNYSSANETRGSHVSTNYFHNNTLLMRRMWAVRFDAQRTNNAYIYQRNCVMLIPLWTSDCLFLPSFLITYICM